MNEEKEIVININSSGAVSALHMDHFDLGFLGNKRIGRASTIEFDEQDQSFFVLVAGESAAPPEVRHFSGYDVARKFEVEWLQACMKAGCRPYSEQGWVLAREIRASNPAFNVHGRKEGGQ